MVESKRVASLEPFRDRLRQVASPDKLLKLAARQLRSSLGLTLLVLARLDRARQKWRTLGKGPPVTREEVDAALLRRALPGQPSTLAMELKLDARYSRILVLSRAQPFGGDQVALARRILDLTATRLRRVADERRRNLVERNYDLFLRRLRGNDLHYQILHALRGLVDYDHSGAVFVKEADLFRLQAEQIAWQKGRSQCIGMRRGPSADEEELLKVANQPFLFRRAEDGLWHAIEEKGATPPHGLPVPQAFLRYHEEDSGRPQPQSAILAALRFEDRCVGVLSLSGQYPLSLSGQACHNVLPLLPLAAIAIHNQLFDLDVERAFLEEQKKTAVADMARGVAHDINNALAVVLLRSRVLREEMLRSAAPGEQVEDIQVIERYAVSCKRIFQGMLHFARWGSAPATSVQLQECLQRVYELNQAALRARGIVCELRIDPSVPAVRGNLQQLEQVIHNLVLNARQASRQGDRMVLALRRRGNDAVLVVANSPAHIPKELLDRVMEPFFSTRSEGHGLGLPLCRSIVVEHGGRFRIRSRQGTGTLVRVQLPLGERG